VELYLHSRTASALQEENVHAVHNKSTEVLIALCT